MKLTGKAKKDFNKWLRPSLSSEEYYQLVTNCFEQFPKSMRYGVYVDWFDSVDIIVDVYLDTKIPESNVFVCIINFMELNDWYESRQEAQTEAIKKANEIYNKL